MKTRFPFLVASAQLGVALALAQPAAATELAFDFIDLGSLGGGQSVAMDLNDQGQVVGWSLLPGDTFPHAFLWEAGVMTPLGKLVDDEQSVARSINNAGMIVGTSERDVAQGYGVYHAVQFSTASAPQELLNLGGTWSMAHDVNDLGQIAGFGTNANDWEVAVIWENGGCTDIGVNSPEQRSRAVAISNLSIPVGSDYTPLQGGERAWVFFNGLWVDLGGESPWANSGGNAINDSGVIAGYMAFPPEGVHATIWVPVVGESDAPPPQLPTIVDLGSLPDFEMSEALAINNNNVVVGYAMRWLETGTEARAILHDGDELIDLNDLLPADFDGVLWEAHGINDNGAIAATALMNDDTWHAFLLTPLVACAEDLVAPAGVEQQDLNAVLNRWGDADCLPGGLAFPCPEDLVQPDGVEQQDLNAVLNRWGDAECAPVPLRAGKGRPSGAAPGAGAPLNR